MDACDYRGVAARNQWSATDGPGPEGSGIWRLPSRRSRIKRAPQQSNWPVRRQPREYIADSCLSDGPVGRVGLEVEAHCYDPADPIPPTDLG